MMMSRFLPVCVAVMCAMVAFAEKQPFERYQSIVDRQMFGTPPKGFDPTKKPSEVSRSAEKELTQEQEKLQSAVHFSVMNINAANEVEVGFTDNSDPKVPLHYFLKVGESMDGWTVREADPQEATVLLAKDDIEVSLKLGDNSGKGGGKTEASAASSATRAARPSGSVPPSPTPTLLTGRSSGLLGAGNSLRARRMEREAKRNEAIAAAKAEADAKAEAERLAREEREAAERAEREAEREKTRKELMDLKEAISRVNEAKKAAEAEKAAESEKSSEAEGSE